MHTNFKAVFSISLIAFIATAILLFVGCYSEQNIGSETTVIKGNIKLVVQFGDVFNNDNEELLILPVGEHQLDIKQYIYEMIALSIPLKRVHPGVKDGTLKSEALDKLKENSAKEIKKEKKEEEIDPRWDKLKQLLTDK